MGTLSYSLPVLLLIMFTSKSISCESLTSTSPIDTLEIDPDLLSPPYEDIFKMKEHMIEQRASKLKLSNSDLSLPGNLIPTKYQIKIRPILETSDENELFTAPGSVLINFKCVESTDSIILHAKTKDSMQIKESSVTIELQINDRNVSENFITPLAHLYDEKDNDFYRIMLSNPLEKGEEYSVYIEFTSKIETKSLRGLYLSTYKDPMSSHKKNLAVTQFEDISARKMFPCFDEPGLKASFQISISRLEKYSSMSNMALDRTEPDPQNLGYFLDHYPPTPLMSSYIVALIVSEFSCTRAPATLYDKPIEACGPKYMIDVQNGGVHAAKVSAEILKFYDELFMKKYPFPKMQSVAIPDFAAGAMENYGLNTYRISALLYFPGKTSEVGRKRIESVIAHELAHQNFGNLVTAKTWNHLVMNEGFAEFVSYIGSQKVGPEFRQDKNWQVGYFQRALKRDALEDTHPVVKLNDFFGDFDAITYAKGASLIKMMERLLTPETLIKGLRKYLASFSFSNAEFPDLLRILDQQAHKDKTHPKFTSLNEIMENWFVKPGFPLIRVSRTTTSPSHIHISQERFVHKDPAGKDLLRNNETLGNLPSLWFCPIFISTQNNMKNAQPALWLTSAESHISLDTSETSEWIIVNPDSAGFFRVLYDQNLSSAIKSQLNTNPNLFSSITRVQLIDDAFELAWAHHSAIAEALERTEYLSYETDADVWLTALSHFNKIFQMLSEEKTNLHKLKAYLRPKIENTLSAIGVEQSPVDKGEIVIQRKSLLAWGGSVGVASVKEYANKLSKHWKADTSFIPTPVDIQEEILCTTVQYGDSKDFTFIFEQYLHNYNNDEDQKSRLLSALACSTEVNTLLSLCAKIIDPQSGIETDDGFALLQKLVTNSIIREEIFWFIRDNFNDILLRFNENPGQIVVTFSNLFSRYWNTPAKLQLIKEFIKEHEDELDSQNIEKLNQAEKKIQANIKWMETHNSTIVTWISQRLRV